MSEKLLNAMREELRRHARFDADPGFYEAKARCRHIAKAYGDRDPLLCFHGPRTALYMHGDEMVNLAA